MAEPSATHMTQPGPAPLPGKAGAKGATKTTPFTADVVKTAVEAAPGATADPQLAPSFTTQAARSLSEEVDRIRKTRKPFGAMGQKLAMPERWGYKNHWFNDSPGRIASAEAAGWSYIKDREGKPVSIVVGSARNGQPQLAYAMQLPTELWEEDMAERNKVAADALSAVKAKPFRARPGQTQPSDRGKFYNPEEDAGREPLEIRKG